MNKNTLLHNLQAALSSFKHDEEIYGPDKKIDEQFSAYVINIAKQLAELDEKDPEFQVLPDGKIRITLFRAEPVIYTFDDKPIIAMERDMWYMRIGTQSWEPPTPRIDLTTNEAAIIWKLLYENDV